MALEKNTYIALFNGMDNLIQEILSCDDAEELHNIIDKIEIAGMGFSQVASAIKEASPEQKNKLTGLYSTVSNVINRQLDKFETSFNHGDQKYISLLKNSNAKFKKLSEELLQEIDLEEKIAQVCNKSTKELLIELEEFRSRSSFKQDDYVRLVPLAVELLYRDKGERTPELSTAQQARVVSILKDKGISENIGTVEEKSFIMAVCSACKCVSGCTVDCITIKDKATQNYKNYKSYFDMMGIKSNRIYFDTSPDDYCIGGINYSDVSSLKLFLDKAHCEGNIDKVLDSEESNRFLLLDENADFSSDDNKYISEINETNREFKQEIQKLKYEGISGTTGAINQIKKLKF